MKEKCIGLIILVIIIAIFGGFNVPSAKEENIANIYDCDYKVVSLNTSIDAVDKDGNCVNISGNILRFIEDPLSMKDSEGNIIAYAGDSFNLINQDDHGIYVNGDFAFDVIGEFKVFGDKYYLKNQNNEIIATVKFNALDTTGLMYDASGVLIAQYASAYVYKDYKLYIYDTNTIDEKALLMVFASYVSDKEADNSDN